MSEWKVIDRGKRGVERVLVDVPTLQSVKDAAIAKVNPEARRRIEAIDWQVTRATEQPELYSLPDVLAARQAIRDASNKAKVDINAFPAETTPEEVKAFNW